MELILLTFVWDETASGTVRSNRGNGMECVFSVLLLAVPEAVSSHIKARSRSAVQSILRLAPCCPIGSLVPYKSDEHQFCEALLTERTVCGVLADKMFPITLTKTYLVFNKLDTGYACILEEMHKDKHFFIVF